MAKPCNQAQIKKFPWTRERSAALLDEAMRDFISKGQTLTEAINGLSARHMLKREIIAEGLSGVKGVSRKVTDEMWVRAQQRRTVEAQARQFTKEINKPGWQKKAEMVVNAPRRFAIIGHFAAFTKTHLADQLFYNPAGYYKNFKESWSLGTPSVSEGKLKFGKAGMARLERDIDTMTSEPEYNAGVRAGVDIKPGGGGIGDFKTETSEATGSIKTNRASLAFDRLRVSRYKIWKKEYNRLSTEEKANKDQLEALAHVINNDTGTTAVRSKLIKFLLFAPRLFPAQLKHTFYDIPRALVQTGFGFNYKNAAPAMRYVARKSAILAGTYTATLALNEAVGLVTGKKEFTPNITDSNKRDWLRPKLFGYSVPISPTVELLKLPIQMMAAARAAKNGDSALMKGLMRGVENVLGRQNPTFAIIEQLLLGEEPGTGRPLPTVAGHEIGLVTQAKPGVTRPRQTWTEFLGSKMPIWMANYSHEMYNEMREQGMDHLSAKSWIHALTTGTIEAITSYHISEAHEGFKTRKEYEAFKRREQQKPKPKEVYGFGP